MLTYVFGFFAGAFVASVLRSLIWRWKLNRTEEYLTKRGLGSCYADFMWALEEV